MRSLTMSLIGLVVIPCRTANRVVLRRGCPGLWFRLELVSDAVYGVEKLCCRVGSLKFSA